VEFSKEVCRSMVAMLDYDRSGKLRMDEFKKLMYEIAKWTVIDEVFLISTLLIRQSSGKTHVFLFSD
jgi:hypothetical protein